MPALRRMRQDGPALGPDRRATRTSPLPDLHSRQVRIADDRKPDELAQILRKPIKDRLDDALVRARRMKPSPREANLIDNTTTCDLPDIAQSKQLVQGAGHAADWRSGQGGDVRHCPSDRMFDQHLGNGQRFSMTLLMDTS